MKDCPIPDAASFRDPDGYVFRVGDRVFRALRRSGLELYHAFRESGAADWAEQRGLVARSWELRPEDRTAIGELPSDVVSVLEQERIPFLTYPYEWTFDMLKDAALLQIDLSLGVAQYHLTLKDATPFNIQFADGKPVFIDVLSFVRYQEGMPWVGYAQFCRSFLYPLALKTFCGIDCQPLLRNYLDGIPVGVMRRILGIRAWLHRGMIKHLIVQSILQKSFERDTPRVAEDFRTLRFSQDQVSGLMRALRKLIANLSVRHTASSWSSYREDHPYTPEAHQRKQAFVVKHLEKIAPASVWDIGCNTGEFSLLAANYTSRVIALDADPDSVNRLYRHCKTHAVTKVLPLVADIMNPSPALGWGLSERQSLYERDRAECVLALALLHHLCLALNVPFSRIFSLFARMGAKDVMIEFVPKTDRMVRNLLANREDVYPWYTQAEFEKEALILFSIGERVELEKDGRVVYWLLRRTDA